MSRLKLNKRQREQIHNLDFNQLYIDAYKYYNRDKVSFKELFEYYLTLDNHLDVTYNMLYNYYLRYKREQTPDNIRCKQQMNEPYLGHNKVILYYLNKLEKDSELDVS